MGRGRSSASVPAVLGRIILAGCAALVSATETVDLNNDPNTRHCAAGTVAYSANTSPVTLDSNVYGQFCCNGTVGQAPSGPYSGSAPSHYTTDTCLPGPDTNPLPGTYCACSDNDCGTGPAGNSCTPWYCPEASPHAYLQGRACCGVPVDPGFPVCTSNDFIYCPNTPTGRGAPLEGSCLSRSGDMGMPTAAPTTLAPTAAPTAGPTASPTRSPTESPTTSDPTTSPTTSEPTKSPTSSPTTFNPTASPTDSPATSGPTAAPTTAFPTASPTTFPTTSPTASPTESPTVIGRSSSDSTDDDIAGLSIQLLLGILAGCILATTLICCCGCCIGENKPPPRKATIASNMVFAMANEMHRPDNGVAPPVPPGHGNSTDTYSGSYVPLNPLDPLGPAHADTSSEALYTPVPASSCQRHVQPWSTRSAPASASAAGGQTERQRTDLNFKWACGVDTPLGSPVGSRLSSPVGSRLATPKNSDSSASSVGSQMSVAGSRLSSPVGSPLGSPRSTPPSSPTPYSNAGPGSALPLISEGEGSEEGHDYRHLDNPAAAAAAAAEGTYCEVEVAVGMTDDNNKPRKPALSDITSATVNHDASPGSDNVPLYATLQKAPSPTLSQELGYSTDENEYDLAGSSPTGDPLYGTPMEFANGGTSDIPFHAVLTHAEAYPWATEFPTSMAVRVPATRAPSRCSSPVVRVPATRAPSRCSSPVVSQCSSPVPKRRQRRPSPAYIQPPLSQFWAEQPT